MSACFWQDDTQFLMPSLQIKYKYVRKLSNQVCFWPKNDTTYIMTKKTHQKTGNKWMTPPTNQGKYEIKAPEMRLLAPHTCKWWAFAMLYSLKIVLPLEHQMFPTYPWVPEPILITIAWTKNNSKDFSSDTCKRCRPSRFQNRSEIC